MSNLTRREFLLSLAALPFLKMAAPQLALPGLGRLARPVAQDTGTAAASDASAPNILMLVFDAFSAHDISLYGFQRETTPNLARLAESATVFHRHYAGANFTSPGTATLLTGLYPWHHRSFQHYSHTLESVAGNNVFNLLPDAYYKVGYTHNPLAAALLYQFGEDINQLASRREHALTDGLWSEYLFPHDYPVTVHADRAISGLNGRPPIAIYLNLLNRLRFNSAGRALNEAFADVFPRGLPGADFDALYLLEDAVDWVAELTNTVATPYFMYLHMMPPHAPYNTRREFVDIFNDGWQPAEKPINPVYSERVPQSQLVASRQKYDEYIAYVDAEFGRLFATLEANGTLDNTYIIVTSDHGEMFERATVGHGGIALYEPVVQIPLMVWKPGQKEHVDVYDRTSAIDVLPTLLHLTGQPIPERCEGVVLPTFGGDGVPADRMIYSVEAKNNSSFGPLTTATVAQYHGPHKLIYYTGYKRVPSAEGYFELFNLENDPQEMENRYDSDKTTAQEMTQRLRETLAEVDRPFQRG